MLSSHLVWKALLLWPTILATVFLIVCSIFSENKNYFYSYTFSFLVGRLPCIKYGLVSTFYYLPVWHMSEPWYLPVENLQDNFFLFLVGRFPFMEYRFTACSTVMNFLFACSESRLVVRLSWKGTEGGLFACLTHLCRLSHDVSLWKMCKVISFIRGNPRLREKLIWIFDSQLKVFWRTRLTTKQEREVFGLETEFNILLLPGANHNWFKMSLNGNMRKPFKKNHWF